MATSTHTREATEAVHPRDRSIEIDGLKLHYVEWGNPSGEIVIFIHGNRDQSRSWDFLVEQLLQRGDRDFHFVAVDLRGHGDSDWLAPGRSYQHVDFLGDLAALVSHLKKEPVILVGHSLGGSMAILFAGCFPKKVRKLVLIEAAGPYARADHEVPPLMARWLAREAESDEASCYSSLEEAAKAIQKRFSQVPDHAALHMARHGTKSTERGFVWKHDPRMRFPSYSTLSEGQIQSFIDRIECPSLLIFGASGDFKNSPRTGRIELFKNSKVVFLSDTGHHVAHERPQETAELVGSFLRGA